MTSVPKTIKARDTPRNRRLSLTNYILQGRMIGNFSVDNSVWS